MRPISCLVASAVSSLVLAAPAAAEVTIEGPADGAAVRVDRSVEFEYVGVWHGTIHIGTALPPTAHEVARLRPDADFADDAYGIVTLQPSAHRLPPGLYSWTVCGSTAEEGGQPICSAPRRFRVLPMLVAPLSRPTALIALRAGLRRKFRRAYANAAKRRERCARVRQARWRCAFEFTRGDVTWSGRVSVYNGRDWQRYTHVEGRALRVQRDCERRCSTRIGIHVRVPARERTTRSG